MSGDRFKVSRRYAGTPWELSAHRDAKTLIPDFYQPLTPLLKTIGYGLFALTDDEPDQSQEVSVSDILEVIEVAKHPLGGGAEQFHGQHYRDAFEALERLFNVAVPLKTKRLRQEGEKWITEHRIDYVRLLDKFGLVYLNPKTGKPLSIDDDARYQPYRVDISGKELPREPEPEPKKRRRRGRKRSDDDQPVWALVKLDKAGEWVRDTNGDPILRTPDRYRFRWSREVVADLLHTEEGRGWLNMNRAIFRVLRNLRRANNGRGHPTAARLFELIFSDIVADKETRQRLVKPAKRVFAALGFPEPGDTRKHHLHQRDGRWSENVARTAEAVRLLKAEGVLLPESDEEPFTDPNPERRKAPYYRWIRAAEWTFTAAMEIVDNLQERTRTEGAPPRTPFLDPETVLPDEDLFGQPLPKPGPSGRDIRAAREAAGMTLREFTEQFGGSTGFWSSVENETPLRRTGRPRPLPPEVREAVSAFVAEHLDRDQSMAA